MVAISHRNNFDFLRLLFALFVLITHSYPLTGIDRCDILCQYTHEQALLSDIGLQGFFIISGYLVCQSLQRSKNLLSYYWKRILRLYPALIVVLVLTVLLAPFAYHNDQVFYWQNAEVYTYIPRNLSLFFIQYSIKGVFAEIPYKGAINGSLWTLAYEFALYVALSGLFLVRKYQRVTIVLLGTVFILLFVMNGFYYEQLSGYSYILRSGDLMLFGCFFAAGALLATIQYAAYTRYHNALLAACGIIALISLFAPFHYQQVRFIVLPIIIITAGIKCTSGLCDIGEKVGDLSYGIYIYAFPVQQALVYFFGLNYIQLTLMAIPISILLAYVSWHLVEKRALKWKYLKL